MDAPAEAALLRRCRRFRTLDGHLEAVGDTLRLDTVSCIRLRPVLERFVREGRLLSEGETVRRVARQTAHEDPDGAIDVIGFVTRDRPATLARGVRAYAGHARDHGRTVRVVVVDDDPHASALPALTALQPELGAPLCYAGPEEKERFVQRLVRLGAAPRGVVDFALLDPFRTASTYGANRNALFLEVLGEMVLSADDDTLPRTFAAPGASPGLRVGGGRPPIDYRFFPDLDSGIDGVEESDDDVLGILRSLLGRPVPELFSGATGPVDLERMGPELLERVLADGGRVVAVMPGMLGDGGGESPLYQLLSARGASHRAMVATSDTYHVARSSRIHLRACPSPALSQGGFLMTTAIAFDARTPLPPFFPVFRCEDNLYGDLLRWCRPHDWIGHVPTALLHAPEPPRSYGSDPLRSPGHVLPLLALAALVMEGAPLEGTDPAQRMRDLGRHLEDRARAATLEGELRARLAQSLRNQIRFVRACQELHRASPAWWHRDMDRHVAAMEAVDPGSVSLLPQGISSLADVRTLFAAYGRLLQAWPDLWEATVQLRSHGQGLARSLYG